MACYFPTNITQTDDFAQHYPHGVGAVSALEAPSVLTLAEVSDFQYRIRSQAMNALGHQIPCALPHNGLCGAYLPGATSIPPDWAAAPASTSTSSSGSARSLAARNAP